jgi:hypothetical protein
MAIMDQRVDQRGQSPTCTCDEEGRTSSGETVQPPGATNHSGLFEAGARWRVALRASASISRSAAFQQEFAQHPFLLDAQAGLEPLALASIEVALRTAGRQGHIE